MASFVGFSEPVLAEEFPKPSVQSKTGPPKKQRNTSGKEKAAASRGLVSQGNKMSNSSSSTNLRAHYGAATVRNKVGGQAPVSSNKFGIPCLQVDITNSVKNQAPKPSTKPSRNPELKAPVAVIENKTTSSDALPSTFVGVSKGGTRTTLQSSRGAGGAALH